MPTCQMCVGGYVRKFRARTETEKAGWYDDVCPECKGNYLTEPETIPEQLEKHAAVGKAEDDEIPF